MNKPFVSVIIVTLNNKMWLRTCLEALQKQVYRNIEIFVVDNGSTDKTKAMVKKYFSKVIYIATSSNIGFGPAANYALKKSQGKYVLIYNDDAICTKDFISLLVHRIEKDKKIGAIQGTLLHADQKNIIESTGAFLTPTGILIKESGMKFDGKKEKEREVFNANLPLIRRSILQKIGYFDDDYFLYFEEAGLCWRIWLAGYTILYYPSAIIYHARGITTKRLKAPIIIKSTFFNRINSLVKNLEFKSLLWILPIHLIICFGGIIAYILKGKPKSALAIGQSIFLNITFLKKTLRKRKIIQQYRTIKDKELFLKIMQPMQFSYLYKMASEYVKQW